MICLIFYYLGNDILSLNIFLKFAQIGNFLGTGRKIKVFHQLGNKFLEVSLVKISRDS